MRARPDRSLRAALLGLLVIVVGAAVAFVPFLTRERAVYASTPSPPPLFELHELGVPPGSDACLRGVALDERSEVLRFRTTATPDEVELAIRAPGYRVELVRTGVREGPLLDVPVDPPARPVVATVCLHVNGTAAMKLVATREPRTRSAVETTIDGEPFEADVALQVLERRRESLAARAGELVAHATAFRPPIVGRGVVWAVALLVVVGVPAAVLWALRRGAQA